MAQRSEEQIIDRLFTLENEGMADRRAELTGERFLSLIHDPASGRAYEARQAGELVEEDSDEGLGDEEVDGAELHDVYFADDDDPLVAGEEDVPRER